MFLGWLFWAAIILAAIWLLASRVAPGRGAAGAGEDSSMTILKERFARGEISREEFEQRRKTLLSA